VAAIKLRIARLPEGVSIAQLHGVAILAGVGFTMGLFIGTLAFKDQN
jgi:Na+:H+ antiporter, NhaA family